MKTVLQALVLSLSLSTSAAWSAPTETVPVVPSDFHTVYSPGGFDSNDRVQLILEGVFANTCFRPAPPEVQVNRVSREIRITARAYQYEGSCIQVLVAYDQTVDLGILEAGTYRVLQTQGNGEAREMTTLRVSVSRLTEADDFLYAPVSQAYAENRDGKTTIRVTGSFTDSCMKLSEIRLSDEPKVIVVQPIATREERPDCTAGNYPFDRAVELRGTHQGRYLLHVRSLSGKAFNHLVDLN